MGAQVVEYRTRPSRFARQVVLRIDLHGVSVFGPGRKRSLVRWEWIEDITAGDEVVVRSAQTEVRLPAGSFGLSAQALAERLRAACDIAQRADIIDQLSER